MDSVCSSGSRWHRPQVILDWLILPNKIDECCWPTLAVQESLDRQPAEYQGQYEVQLGGDDQGPLAGPGQQQPHEIGVLIPAEYQGQYEVQLGGDDQGPLAGPAI